MRGRKQKAWRTGDVRIVGYAPGAMFPGWDLADWRIAAKADYPALSARLGQQWRDAADTYDTETHFRFPDGRRFIKGATWTAGAPLACAFPLADAVPGYDAPIISGDGQTIHQLLPAGASSYGIASFTQTIPGNAGVTVVRMGVNNLPLFAADGSEGWAGVGLAFYGAGPSLVLAAQIIANATGAYEWATVGAGGPSGGGALASLPGFLDIRFRAAAGLIDVALPNGTVLDSIAYTPQVVVPLLSIAGVSVAGDGIGRIPSVSFVTAAADMTDSPFVGGGAVDACGNVLGATPAAVSNVGTRGGNATSGGHALTAGELPPLDVTLPVAQRNSSSSGGAEDWPVQVGNGDTLGNQTLTVAGTGNLEHSHPINPEHSLFLVLVKL